MHIAISIDTENLSPLDWRILAMLGGVATAPAEEAEEAVTVTANATGTGTAAAKGPAKNKAATNRGGITVVPEPEPTPEPMAEEPIVDEPEDEPVEDADEQSDEDLLALAVKKATEMVASGEAAKVREALDAAGASRVRELNQDNVREFFKALS